MYRFINRIFTLILIVVLAGLQIPVKSEEKKNFTVVIDAGHGGKDIGATDNGVMEKNINLKVAKQLESLIKKKMKHTDVVMTREGDTYLTLQQRADKANKSQGDIFISIHTNSVDKKNRNRKNIAGSSVYTLGLHKDENNLEVAMRENSVIELEKDYQQKYSGFDPQRDESYIIFEMAQKKNLSQSIKFAESVEKELVGSGRQNRGVHQAGFWVLWATSMPSVLIELDFICNPESAKYMASDKGAKELAEAIFNALKKYRDTWNKNLVGDNQGSNDTFIAETSPEVVTYSLSSGDVATAKTRSHKRMTNDKTPTQSKGKTGERRRRSAHSKEISNNQDFEQENLKTPGVKNYASISVGTGEENLSMAKTTEKESKKKNKKKSEKVSDKKEAKSKRVRKEDSHNGKLNKLVTVYKIQILASTDLLNQGNSRFCGLSPVTAYKENNLYKYYYGESTDKNEIESLLTDVRKKIPDAFIVKSQKSQQPK